MRDLQSGHTALKLEHLIDPAGLPAGPNPDAV